MAASSIFGWLTPTLPKLLDPDSVIQMTPEDASWLVAVPEFGNLISPIPAAILADRFGRKIVILFSGPLILIGWIIVLCFRSILALYIARIIQGLANGVVYAVIPMYLGEIAAPKYRGMVISTFYIAWWFGFLFEYFLGPMLTVRNFIYVTAMINVLFIVTFIWQPESPYYYLMKNDFAKAEQTLSLFLDIPQNEIHVVSTKIKQSLEQDMTNKIMWKELIVNPTYRKSMKLAISIAFVRTLCGLWSLSCYSTETLVYEDDYFFLSPDGVTIAMGVMMMLSAFASFFTLDIFGRVSLFFFSCFTSGIVMFCVGTFYLLKTHTHLDISSFSWVPAVGFMIFSATSGIGIFPVTTAYQAELFDTKSRSVASGILTVYCTILSVVPLKLYMTIAQNFGVFLNFYMFTFVCFFGAILSHTSMPETNGTLN